MSHQFKAIGIMSWALLLVDISNTGREVILLLHMTLVKPLNIWSPVFMSMYQMMCGDTEELEGSWETMQTEGTLLCKVYDALLNFLKRIMYGGLITWYRKACTEELPNTVRPVTLINEDITVPSFISWWHANLV